MTTEASGAALLSRRYGPPIWLFERSAAARAKASQSTVDEILNGWVEEAGNGEAASPTEAASPQPPAASPTAEASDATASSSSPSGGGAAGGGGGGQALTGAALLTAVAQARGMPESLVERSAQARASAAGVSLDDVLHEWAEEEGLEAASPREAASPTAEASDATASSSSPSGGGAAEGGGGGQALTGAALLAAVAEARGMPESLVERSAQARASAAGVSLDDVLHEWAEEEGLEAASPREAASPTAEASDATASSSSPSGGGAAEGGGGGQALTGAALLTAVAQARGMPESLVERSAQARASAAGVSLDDVLHEWAEEEGLEAASDQTPDSSPRAAASTPLPTPKPKPKPDAPAATGLTGAALLTAVAEARGMPESLVERSASARAKKTDASVDDVLNEWAAEAGLGDASPQTPDASPTEAASPKAATAGTGLTGAALLTAVAEARGMPESLVERSAKARAKKTDVSVDDVLNEWAAEAGLGDASPQTPDASPREAASPTAEASDATASSSSPSGGGAAEGGGGGQALTGAALLTAVAEARGMPESLVERSAKARAKKTDASVDNVLHEWAAEAGLGDASPQTPDASDQLPAASPTAEASDATASSSSPSGGGAAEGGGGGQALTGAALLTAVAEARGMPESLVERSASARAKKTDASVDDVLNEWAAEAGLGDASPQTPDASPTEAASAKAATAGTGLTGAALLTAVAEARGMPESLVERSAKARAKKTDVSVDDVLNEWAAEAGLGDASPQTPDASPREAASPQLPAASPADAASPQTPDASPAATTGLAEVASQPVKSRRHSLTVGALAAAVPLVILAVLAVFVDVPSSLSEAPWPLIGLEPFLGYLEPFTVLVIIPGVVLSSIVITAAAAWSPAVHPSTRRVALMVLVFLILTIASLSIIGAIQR